jgi:hypothetical protein
LPSPEYGIAGLAPGHLMPYIRILLINTTGSPVPDSLARAVFTKKEGLREEKEKYLCQ